MEKRESRDRLAELVKNQRVYCSKHDRPVKTWEFWGKRCYAGRNNCQYMEVRDEQNRIHPNQ